ncbi:hypothetical protein SEVIR_7G223450v4 [Setaria viridis]
MYRLLREESKMSGDKDKLYRVIRVVDKMEAMVSYLALNKDRFAPSSLERTVFSWSIEDIFNRDLLRHQVKRIPNTFTSLESYLNSFAGPLIEEVHADSFSSLDGYAQASFTQVIKLQKLNDDNPIW